MINIEEVINTLINIDTNSNELVSVTQQEFKDIDKEIMIIEKICEYLDLKDNDYVKLAKALYNRDNLLNPLSLTTVYELKDILELVKNKSLSEIIYSKNEDALEKIIQFYIYLIDDVKKLNVLKILADSSARIIPDYIEYATENPSSKEMILRDYKKSIAHEFINNNVAKDNFLEIAYRFGIKLSDLYKFNGIDINHSEYLKPNADYIKIPTAYIDIAKIKIPCDIRESFNDGTLDMIPNLTKRRDYNYLTEMLVRLNYIRNFKFLGALKIIDDEEILYNIFSKYPLSYQYIMAPFFRTSGSILDDRISELKYKHKVKKYEI